MGCFPSKPLWKFVKGWSKSEQIRIVMVGLDAAGKTTLLYKLKLGEIVTKIPTIGFNVETVTRKNVDIVCWDVGGCDKIRPLWTSYIKGCKGLIFVVDSKDRDRMVEAREELRRILARDEFGGDVPLLVFANKQDELLAMNVEEVTRGLGLAEVTGREWPATFTSGDGAYEGLEWLSDRVKGNLKSSPPLPDKLASSESRSSISKVQ